MTKHFFICPQHCVKCFQTENPKIWNPKRPTSLGNSYPHQSLRTGQTLGAIGVSKLEPREWPQILTPGGNTAPHRP